MAESKRAGSDGEKLSRLSWERRPDSNHNEKELASNKDFAEPSKCSSLKKETVPRRLFEMDLFSAKREKLELAVRESATE